DGGGAGAAHAVGGHRELVVEMDVDVVVALAAGESGGGEAVAALFGRRDSDAVVVQVSPGAPLGGEHLLTDRVVDDACDHFAGARQAEGHVEAGKAVGEVGG